MVIPYTLTLLTLLLILISSLLLSNPSLLFPGHSLQYLNSNNSSTWSETPFHSPSHLFTVPHPSQSLISYHIWNYNASFASTLNYPLPISPHPTCPAKSQSWVIQNCLLSACASHEQLNLSGEKCTTVLTGLTINSWPLTQVGVISAWKPYHVSLINSLSHTDRLVFHLSSSLPPLLTPPSLLSVNNYMSHSRLNCYNKQKCYGSHSIEIYTLLTK